jgi:hypothetical protein
MEAAIFLLVKELPDSMRDRDPEAWETLEDAAGEAQRAAHTRVKQRFPGAVVVVEDVAAC